MNTGDSAGRLHRAPPRRTPPHVWMKENMTMYDDTTTAHEAEGTPESDLRAATGKAAAEPMRSALAEALEEMERERATGEARAVPPFLSLDALTENREAFWLRSSGEPIEYLLSDLRQALRTREELDAIHVYVCGRTTYILDGHHRVEAYRREGRSKIPVRAFDGPPVEARAFVVGRACKASLPLTGAERSNAAWQSVLSGSYRQNRIVTLTGVSARTVATMTKVHRALGDAAFGYAHWWSARQAWQEGIENQRSLTEWEWEEYDRQQGEAIASAIGKALGPRLQKNPRAAAIGLATVLGQKGTEFAEAFCGLDGIDWPPDFDDEDENTDF